MNKSVFYYLPVLLLIGSYFYFTHWLNQNYNEALKYAEKVEHNEWGKQITRFNTKDAIKNDFYIVIDSNRVRQYFRVVGTTHENQVAINHGRYPEILPKVLDYNSYLRKETYKFLNITFDKVINWVKEIVEEDSNFETKVDLLTQDNIDDILCYNKVMGITEGKDLVSKHPLLLDNWAWNLRVLFVMGDPIILIPIIILLVSLFWAFDKLKNILVATRKTQIHNILGVIAIAFFAYFLSSEIVGSSYNGGSKWYGISFVFISYTVAFFCIQYLKSRTKGENFAKKQLIVFLGIIVIGFLTEIVVKSGVNFFFYLEKPDGQYKESFSTILFWAFALSIKNWIMIATANFLHNIIHFITSLWRKGKQLKERTEHAVEAENLLLESETQVNSFFLKNSLHAIAALAPFDVDKTETLALSLAKYYRYTTNRKDEACTTIGDEFDAMTAYLEVEKIRLGDKLEYIIDVSSNVTSLHIPKFLLIPLVENAIKYGYNMDQNSTKIMVTATTTMQNLIKISICDSGRHFDENIHSGKGITSLVEKLKHFYPNQHTLSFINDPKKCVEIVLNNQNVQK